MKRCLPLTVPALAMTVLFGGTSLAQSYDYGGGGGYSSAQSGWLAELEVGMANPRNTDNIVAAVGPNVVIPTWGEEFAGRIGIGYQFATGNKVIVRFWGTEADQSESGVGTFSFPIGPISGFSFDVTTTVEAHTADIVWALPHEVNEKFEVEWELGLRYAGYEETTGGYYGTTAGLLGVSKLNKGTMLGARVAGRATYRLKSFSLGGSVGLSLLDGEVEGSQSLSPLQPGLLPLVLIDDSRSGTILDFDVRAAWHNNSDDLSVWIGWEQQVWEDIAADLARNLPGSNIIARERDSVSFSWVKLGVSYVF